MKTPEMNESITAVNGAIVAADSAVGSHRGERDPERCTSSAVPSDHVDDEAAEAVARDSSTS